MRPESNRRKNVGTPSLSVRFGQALRRYFVTGVATLFPVWATLFLVWKLFQFVDGFLGNLLAGLIGFQIPGLGLVATVLVILCVGVLSIHFFGRVLFRTVESWLNRIPILKIVYPLVRQLADFLFGEKKGPTLRRVVLTQYPRPGAYSIAFVTNESKTNVTGSPKTLLTLLIPNPPSPFTGPIIFVPEEDATPLDLSVEDAVKLIVSGGVVASPLRAAEMGTAQRVRT